MTPALTVILVTISPRRLTPLMSLCHNVVTRCLDTCHCSRQTQGRVLYIITHCNVYLITCHMSQGGLAGRLGLRLGSLRSEVGEFLIKHPLTDHSSQGLGDVRSVCKSVSAPSYLASLAQCTGTQHPGPGRHQDQGEILTQIQHQWRPAIITTSPGWEKPPFCLK